MFDKRFQQSSLSPRSNVASLALDLPLMPRASVIVIGNEKGGSGKTTTAMHLVCALLDMGFDVGVVDLDFRQRSLTRYMENRLAYIEHHGTELLMPRNAIVRRSQSRDRDIAYSEDMAATNVAIDRLIDSDFLIIDCPGSDTPFSRTAHERADLIITPVNDSLVDLDLLARIHPETLEVVEHSIYSSMVWDARKIQVSQRGQQADWLVVRNRLLRNGSTNGNRVGELLDKMAKRYGFRVGIGFTERVVYRELFLSGLTMLDCAKLQTDMRMDMAHLAARQEVRGLLSMLNLAKVQEQLENV